MEKIIAILLLFICCSNAQIVTNFALSDGATVNGVSRSHTGNILLSIYGSTLTTVTTIGLTSSSSTCVDSFGTTAVTTANETIATATLNINEDGIFFLCVNDQLVGTAKEFQLETFTIDDSGFVPLWVAVILVIFLLGLSGLFSGLNLGLMALDTTGLKIIMNSGSKKEKGYAKKIYPLRKRGNFLLCSLLLGNVLVNNTLTILLDMILGGGGIWAVIGSTAAIVVFGEIVPQSICTRHGLAIGAYTIWLTKFFMLATCPVSYPISKILDLMLGAEIGVQYKREELKELLYLTGAKVNLQEGEIQILGGALDFSSKTVSEVMTPIDDVFSLDVNTTLDFKTMSTIMNAGHSRIPVYEDSKRNIIGTLMIKDLALIDPDDEMPLKTVIHFYKHKIMGVFDDLRLDEMLDQFKQANTHMAIVTRVNSDGDGDPFYETVGLVTLEDIIEEIIQAEIVDETDVVVDNVTRLPTERKNIDFRIFESSMKKQPHRMTPQLKMAILAYLTGSFPEFSEENISRGVLQRLIDSAEYLEPEYKDHEEEFLYKRGETSDAATLIIQGKVTLNVGKDNMIFEAGSFTLLGIQTLTDSSYELDFSASVASNDCLLLRISSAFYLAAVHATTMQRNPSISNISMDGSNETYLFLDPRASRRSSTNTPKTPKNERQPIDLSAAAIRSLGLSTLPAQDHLDCPNSSFELTAHSTSLLAPNITGSNSEPTASAKRDSHSKNSKAGVIAIQSDDDEDEDDDDDDIGIDIPYEKKDDLV